jgi:hypothetical protein
MSSAEVSGGRLGQGATLGAPPRANRWQQGDGSCIINIGTILATNGVHGLPSSARIATKGGIMALTKNLSVELATEHIRINAVAPGIVPTPLYGALSSEHFEALHRMQPLGRYGTTNDIADAVLYLANATCVTGVILLVDGGLDAGGDGTYHGTNRAAGSVAARTADRHEIEWPRRATCADGQYNPEITDKRMPPRGPKISLSITSERRGIHDDTDSLSHPD